MLWIMHKSFLLSLLKLSFAYDVIGITCFQSIDCSGESFSDTHILDFTMYNLTTPIQSFILNRSMTTTEQIDFSTASNNDTQCGYFEESFWNLSTVCQHNIPPSTCVKYWDNTGPSEDTPGKGWGWNNGAWVNITQAESVNEFDFTV